MFVPRFQLEWESAIVEYTTYLYKKVAVHGNASASNKAIPRVISKDIPLLGPKFSPPSFLHVLWRDAAPIITPETAYMSPLTVVHPVFYPTEFTECPGCGSKNFRWDGWTSTGARSVHGIRADERAIGFQLRCKDCEETKAPGGHCFATTNTVFWDKWNHWRIPSTLISLPYVSLY
ncbi:hypothetical protein BDN70DRAFT_814699 [Pholiota conissans]|uniref:Uncharacterized protein n=1 Tax=Pholiota conissans TaxID=109636 RepID=A0A9P5YTV6_9AGAR|nr:hypothetical protein BDN70DRAFT_814699 [Pholiota conissans]